MTELDSLNVLFICRHNGVRSQLAEVLATKLGQGKVTASSAGPEPTSVPNVIQSWANDVMGGKYPLECTPLREKEGKSFDLVVTLCDKSHAFPASLTSDSEHIRWDFPQVTSIDDLPHLETEIADRVRLLLLSKHLI